MRRVRSVPLRLAEVAGLAAISYLPFLASSRGRVSGDTKQYLYLDPGAFLARVPYLWDPHVGAGTVPHQQIGYLFPMGPWFWLFQELGVPDWVAQRLWLGSITFGAALGARWLLAQLGTGRIGALAGALVYALTPYQLAFTSGLSVLLLPWAGLPWLVGLTMRAVRRGGWTDPALFALVVLVIGGINASALVLAGIGPLIWLVLELFRGRRAARAALAATARIAVLTLATSIWWIVGLVLQGSYGLPVLRLTESLSTVADRSSPDDLLRGLGNWLLYAQDRFGDVVDQASDYATHNWVGLASYAIPVAALLAAGALRWRHRSFAVLLVVVGTVVGVGAWPYDHPSAYGALWKAFAGRSSVGLALRNSPRVVPVVILGVALLLGAAVGALRSRYQQVGAGLAVGALALAALGPVWRTGFLSDGHERPEKVPDYWSRAAVAIDKGGDSTRLLEMPGSNFAAYTWGNAVEPITPGLTKRPYLAREVLPYGSAPSVNLLDALDRREQAGVFEPASLAPVSRLFGVGTIGLRLDLQSDRFGLRSPTELWNALTSPPAPGLLSPRRFGPPVADPSAAASADPSIKPPPSVALFDVQDAEPIVHTAPVARPIVLAGDGDGIVDAAAAGLVDGRALLLSLPALDPRDLRRALSRDADLILTDSNRRRPEHWFFSVDGTKGPTERAGQTSPDPRGDDYRLQVFPGRTDASRTVVEQVGGRVDATADGGTLRPEDRAVYAFDGDLRTIWRVGGKDPTGERIVLRPDEPVRTDHVTLVQPQEGPRDRVLTQVRLRFDTGKAMRVDLGPRSLTPAGEIVRFPRRTVKRLEIELLATTKPPFNPARANAVGFSEVKLGGVRVSETVRLPTDLATRTGRDAARDGLDVVASRLRVDPNDPSRQDEELQLDRRFVLSGRRSFDLAGTARINPNAPDPVLDAALGTTTRGVRYSASSHTHGDLSARASRAFDGSRATAWTASVGRQQGQFLDVRLRDPATARSLELAVIADGRHSVPTRLRLEADGRTVGRLVVPALPDGTQAGTTRIVRLPIRTFRGRHLRLVIDTVRPPTPSQGNPDPTTAPVSIAEVGLASLPRPAAPAQVASRCRADLLQVDGKAVRVRVTGSAGAARTGLDLRSCSGPLDLGRGSHRLDTAAGLDSGIDIDRLVLGSGGGGRPRAVAPRGARLDRAGASVTVRSSKSTSVDLDVRTDGKPFWLVFGQSFNDGWAARTSSGSLGSRQLVDGYANGWLVTPSHAGRLSIHLDWRPQRLVWLGLALSGLGVAACAAIVMLPLIRRRRSATAAVTLAARPGFAFPLLVPASRSTFARPRPRRTVLGVAFVTLATAAVARPWIGLVAGAVTLLAAMIGPARWIARLGAPAALVLSRAVDEREIAWLAVALLVSDLAIGWMRAADRAPPAAQGGLSRPEPGRARQAASPDRSP